MSPKTRWYCDPGGELLRLLRCLIHEIDLVRVSSGATGSNFSRNQYCLSGTNDTDRTDHQKTGMLMHAADAYSCQWTTVKSTLRLHDAKVTGSDGPCWGGQMPDAAPWTNNADPKRTTGELAPMHSVMMRNVPIKDNHVLFQTHLYKIQHATLCFKTNQLQNNW